MKDWSSVPGCIIKVGNYDIPTLKCLEVVFENILTIAVSLAVLSLFVMLIIGGFKFLTSGGDHKATATAQQTMTYAIAGIAMMALAYIIFRIIEVFTGVSVTKFFIPGP